jgi:hypothetical protein
VAGPPLVHRGSARVAYRAPLSLPRLQRQSRGVVIASSRVRFAAHEGPGLRMAPLRRSRRPSAHWRARRGTTGGGAGTGGTQAARRARWATPSGGTGGGASWKGARPPALGRANRVKWRASRTKASGLGQRHVAHRVAHPPLAVAATGNGRGGHSELADYIGLREVSECSWAARATPVRGRPALTMG